MVKDNELQALIDSGYGLIQHCPFCGSEFTPCGNFKYCSQECYRLANIEQMKTYNHKRVGICRLSQHRNKDYEKESAIIKRERKRLRI